jgi:hypothetical protein
MVYTDNSAGRVSSLANRCAKRASLVGVASVGSGTYVVCLSALSNRCFASAYILSRFFRESCTMSSDSRPSLAPVSCMTKLSGAARACVAIFGSRRLSIGMS